MLFLGNINHENIFLEESKENKELQNIRIRIKPDAFLLTKLENDEKLFNLSPVFRAYLKLML